MQKSINGVGSQDVRAARSLAEKADSFSLGALSGLGRLGGWTAALASTLVASNAFAGPEGARVVRGDVRIQRNGNDTIIKAGRNSIINYRSFDVAAHESVRFQQPDAQSRVLNRIQSSSPTRIDGSLSANGRVYFVNPAGVFFGQNAVVNVAGLYAAAGNISDSDFVKGVDRFTNLTGQVVNEGRISSSMVGLIGSQVANTGTIVAPKGTVVMAAGQEVMVGEKHGTVFVRVEGAATGSDAAAAVENKGRVDATGGRVRMVAGDVYALAVRTTGTIKAADTVIEGTGAGTVTASGTIDASNQGRGGKGGEVRVLGEKVAIDGAQINASGDRGGGTVLIGGNYQGKGVERNASATFVTSDSTINVDALRSGDGGTAVVWADGVTRFFGNLTARGGANGGNGGTAEVSGKNYLLFAGGANLGAPKGERGSLLLDPRDITVVAGVLGSDAGFLDGSIVNFNEPDSTSDISIGAGSIAAIDANVTLQAERDITISSAISMANNGRDLIFQAGDDITVNAAITTRGGSITMTANDAGAAAPTGTGNISINAALDTTGAGQTGGIITLNSGAGTINVAADMTTANAGITFTGAVSITGAGVDLTTSTTGGADKVVSFSSTLGLGGNDLSVTSDEIDFGGNVSGAGNLTLRSSTTSQTIHIADTAAGNQLDLTAAEIAFFQSSLTSLSIGRSDGTGTIVFSGASTFAPATTFIAGGNINVSSALSGSTLVLQSDGVVDVSADITASTALTLHGDFDGSGNASDDVIFSAAGVDLNSASIALRAGDGAGGNSVGSVDATSTNVTYRAAGAGATRPAAFAIRQDEAIADADIPTTGRFGLASPSGTAMSFTSDASTVTVSTDASIAGSNLTLGGSTATVGGAITPATLVVNGNAVFSNTVTTTGLLTVNGDATINANVTTNGVFTVTGNVTLNANVTTDGDAIDFQGTLAVTGSRGLDTTNAGGTATGANISVAGAVTAGAATDDLFLNSGTAGNIDLNSTVGAGTRFDVFQITEANDVDITGAVRAVTFTQSSGQGTSVFNGLLDATSGGISLTGNNFTVNAGATTASGGTMTVTSAGLLTLANVALNLDGLFSKLGAGNTSLATGITTSNDDITFGGAGTVTVAPGTPELAAGSGTVSFALLNLNGQSLTLSADEINFTGAVSGTGAGTLTLRGSGTGTAITVGAATDATGGVLEISDADLANLTDEAAGSIVIGRSNGTADITVDGATFQDAFTLQTGGSNSLVVSALLRGAQTDAAPTLSAGGISLSSTIQTNGSVIQLNSPVILTGGGGALDTTDAGGNAAGADISAASTISGFTAGAQSLFINSGTSGNVTLTGAVGATRLGAFQITQANNVNTLGIAATTITLGNSGGTATFGGLLDTSDPSAGGIDILLNGTVINITTGASTVNGGGMTVGTTGLFTLGGAGAGLNGAFAKNGAGNTALNASIATAGNNVSFNGGNVIVGAGGHEINSGAGTIAFANQLNLNGNSLTLSGDEINFGGSVIGIGTGVFTLRGGSNSTAVEIGQTDDGTAGILEISDADIAAISNNAAGSIVIGRTTSTANVTVDSATFLDAVTIQTGGANTISIIGDLIGSQADAAIALSGGATSLGAAIRTAGATIGLNAGPITLTGNGTIDTTNSGAVAAGNNITIGTAVEGTSSIGQSLTLDAGTGGVITLSSTIGSTTRLNLFQIVNALNVTASDLIRAFTILQSSVGNNATYNGLLDSSDTVQLIGGNIALNGGVASQSTTTVNTAGTLTIANADIDADAGFTRSGTGTTSLGADINTLTGDITFSAGQVTVTAPGVSLLAGSGNSATTTIGAGGMDLAGFGLEIAADEINILGAITGNGSGTLTLRGGANSTAIEVGQTDDLTANVLELSDTDLGNITNEAAATIVIGDAALTTSMTIDSSTFHDAVQFVTTPAGTISVIGTVLGDQTDASLSLSSGSTLLGGTLRTTGSAISLSTPTTLTASSEIDTTNSGAVATGADITLGVVTATNAGVDGLTLRAGTSGDINATADLGNAGAGRLGAVLFASANDVTTQDVFALSIQQLAGTGVSEFSGVLDTTGPGGIALTGTAFTLSGGAVTAGNAAMSVTHTGLLTLATTDLSLDGAFTESGGGAVNMFVDLTTTADAVTFNGPLGMAGQTITTAGGAATFNGPANLTGATVTTGGGAVLFGNAVGLNGGTITTGGGSATFSGLTDLTNATVTTATGFVLISGAAELAGATINTGGGAATFSGASTISSGTLNVGSSGGTISFNSTLDGPGAAILNAGAGIINLVGAVGSTTPLNSLTLTAGTINQGSTVEVNTIGYSSDGDIAINSDVTALNFAAHSGTDGTGNIGFGAGVEINADTISLRAGDGTGGGSAAFVDVVTNSPAFNGNAGAGSSPTAFTMRQDASILDANIANGSQFGNGISGMAYSLLSDEGTVIIATSNKVADSDLTVSGGVGGVEIATGVGLSSLTVNSALLLGGDVLTTGGDITVGGPLSLNSSHILNSSTGSIFLTGGGNLGSDSLTLIGTEIDLGAALSGLGDISFRPATAGQGITLGGATADASLNLTAADLAFLSDGFNSITVGRLDGNGTIATSDVVTFTDPVVLLAPASGGIVAINHTFTGADNATIFIDGSGATTTLGADIITNGNEVTINDSVALAANVTIDTTNGGAAPAGANVTITGTTDADDEANNRNFAITTGTAGLINMGAAVGSQARLFDIAFTGAGITVPDVLTLGNQTYNGPLTVSGSLGALGSGVIVVNGNVTLAGNVIMATGGGGGDGVAIFGTVNGDGVLPRSLLIDAGAGDVAITGDIGTTPLASLNFSGTNISVASATTTGDQTYTGSTTATGHLSAANISATGTTILLSTATTTGNQTYTGSTTASGHLSAANILITGPNISLLSATTTGDQTYAGLTTIAGNMTGEDIAFNGGLTLNADATVTASGTAAFNDFVRSQSGSGRTLSVISPITTFIGTVGAGAGNQLGSLTTDAGGTTTIQSSTIDTLGAVSFGDAVLLTSDMVITSANAGVSFLSTVDSSGGARALTVNDGAGQVTQFLGAVGSNGGPLASLTTNAGGTVQLSSNIISTGAVTFNDAVRLLGDPTITASSITFASTVDSQSGGGARSLSLDATGLITLGGDVGVQDVLQVLNASGGAVTAGNVRTNASQSYAGLMTLGGTLQSMVAGVISIGNNLLLSSDSTIQTAGATTDNVTFGGTIDSVGAPAALTVTAGGDINVAGEIGRSVIANQFALSTLSLTGNTVTVRGARTTGNQIYSGPTDVNGNFDVTGTGAIAFSNALRLIGDSTMTTANGGVTFGSTVNSFNATARNLIVNTGNSGLTRFSGTVGGTNSLASLTTNADGTTRFDANSVRVTGDVVLQDAVLVATDSTFQGTNIRFLGSLNAVNGNPAPTLTLTAANAGSVVFSGPVGQADALAFLVSTGTNSVSIGNNIRTNSGMNFGGAVVITGNSTLNGGNGTLFFQSTINADSAGNNRLLTLLSTAASDIDSPAFRFKGSIGATQALGGLTLGADRATPTAATAVFSDGFDANGKILASSFSTTDSFTIRTGSSGFTMGRGQKIIAFGALTISSSGTVRVGDLTSLTEIFLDAPSVVLKLRDGSSVQQRDPNNPAQIRTIVDSGLDFVAKNRIRTREGANISTDGSGPQPLFATDQGFADTNELAGFTFIKLAEPLAITQFGDPRNNLNQVIGYDGLATGEAGGLPTGLAGAIPRIQERREAATPVSIGRSQKELLREMGIPAQDVPINLLIEFMVGRSLYQDQVRAAKPRIAEGKDYQVTVNRLQPAAVSDAVAAYVALTKKPLLDDSGNQLVNAEGEPQYVSRGEDIKAAVAESYEYYADSLPNPDDANGTGYRAWLESRSWESAAEKEIAASAALSLDAITKYSTFVERIDALGLSPFEASVPKDRVFGEIFPAALVEQMREAIYGKKQVSLLSR